MNIISRVSYSISWAIYEWRLGWRKGQYREPPKIVPTWHEGAKTYLRSGLLVNAIKHCRTESGMSLVDAKAACEALPEWATWKAGQ